MAHDTHDLNVTVLQDPVEDVLLAADAASVPREAFIIHRLEHIGLPDQELEVPEQGFQICTARVTPKRSRP